MNIAIRPYTRSGNTKKLADAVGVAVANEEFHCRSQFGKIHKGKPNEKDLADVITFATKIITK